MKRILGRFRAETKGVAAIEFALIAPALAVIVIFMTDVGIAAVGAMNMQTAVRASVQYAMNGGSDMTVAKNVGMSAWPSEPTDATLSASETCKCGATSITCSDTCNNGQITKFVTAAATATLGGSVIHFTKTITQTVQVE